MKKENRVIISDIPLSVKQVEFSEEKTATLRLILKAKSGYHSEESHEISPQQWYEIIKILQKKRLKSYEKHI